jgi:hypothetical protein
LIMRGWGRRVVKVCHLGLCLPILSFVIFEFDSEFCFCRGQLANERQSAAYTTLRRESTSLAMRARVTRVVIVIREMMVPHGQRGDKAQAMDVDIITITIIVTARERGKRERGVRMRMRRYLSLRAGARRTRDKMR